MTQIVEAVYDGSVLRLETALALEPNTRVRVTIESLPSKDAPPGTFLDTARALNLQGPSDWAINLDHYLYGDSNQSRR